MTVDVAATIVHYHEVVERVPESTMVDEFEWSGAAGRGATMRAGDQGILTSHAGSLPRPDDLISLYRARQRNESDDETGFQHALHQAVADVVAKQIEIGITVPGDGG